MLCHWWYEGWPGLEGVSPKPRGFLRSAQSSPGHPIHQSTMGSALVTAIDGWKCDGQECPSYRAGIRAAFPFLSDKPVPFSVANGKMLLSCYVPDGDIGAF